MYRCPKCDGKLAADAHFCPHCGFNQTNARIQIINSQQAAKGNPPVASTPSTPSPSINPNPPIKPSPKPSAPIPPQTTPSALRTRSIQPGIKRVIHPRTSSDSLKGSAPQPVPPLKQPASPALPMNQPDQPEEIQKQENESTIRPIKTNTPPGSGEKEALPAPHTPLLPFKLAATSPSQSSKPEDVIPAHLSALTADRSESKTALAAPHTPLLPFKREATPPQAQSAKSADAIPAYLAALTTDKPEKKVRPQDDAVRLEDKQVRQESPILPKAETSQGVEDATNAKRFSLTQRYASEQETRHQAAVTPTPDALVPREYSPQINRSTQPNPFEDQIWDNKKGATQLSPGQRLSGALISREYSPQTALGMDVQLVEADTHQEGSESLAATSKAAEHWRESWRDRQRAEAGPAIGITRGQADVAEPLMAMQNSIARIRAVILPKNTNEQPSKNVGFWIALVLLLCIIGGLSAYIISTYLPSTQLAAQIAGVGGAPPTLTPKGTHTNTIAAGQTLYVHGTYFTPKHTITFILDTTSLSAGSIQSNTKGVFDAALSIPATWLAGSYALQAHDNQSGQHAFLDIQILPGTRSMSNNTPLVFTKNDQPLATTGLTFQATMGKSDPAGQRITLTNSGATPIQWSASTLTNNNANWLLLNDKKTGGILASQGTDSISVSISSNGLKSSTKPYTGSVILTVNQDQAIIPVSLVVENTELEVVVSPNPVIASFQGGGTCLPVTLTLINLSSQVVTWNANPYDVDKPHIHLDGQTSEQGTLDPTGLPNDTKVVQITCINAQVGEKLYHINVYYNGIAVNVPVDVRPA